MANDLVSLLYVSEASDDVQDGSEPIEPIVEVSLERNSTLDVTGALVFTNRNFAQVLEGRREAVEELMLSINRDPRHRDVDVIVVEDIERRRFPDWNMAYSGPSTFVDKHIRPLVEKRPDGGVENLAADMLIALMREFAAAGPVRA